MKVTPKIKGRQTGGFQTGGFPDLDLSLLFCPFLSFLGLSRFFRVFPDLLGDGPGIFPIRPFPLSRPIKSTYEEQSRKGPRHNLDLSRKKWETPGFGNPPGLASLGKICVPSSLKWRGWCSQELAALRFWSSWRQWMSTLSCRSSPAISSLSLLRANIGQAPQVDSLTK